MIEEQKQAAKHTPYALPVLVIVSAVVFLFGLGWLALIGPDEPRYAEVAREMFATGDYISTRLCGCLWFEKPALLYWMSAASYHLFGVNEFAARFPSAVAALATVLFVYFTLRRVATERAAFAAALVLATSGIFIGYARVATTDMPLTASMSVSLLSGYLAINARGRTRFGWWALSFGAMGLAMLAKGLVGFLLVIAALALYDLIARHREVISWKELFVGLGIFSIVAATWYVPVTLRHGWPFIEEFFIRHHFQRYTSNVFGHPQPFYFFFFVAIAGVIPWSFFLIPAAWRIKELKPRAVKEDSLISLAWVWIVVPVVFFSLSESKLPGYILPVFPALAIIVGFEIERLLSSDRSRLSISAAWLTALFLIAAGVGLIVYSNREGVSASGWRNTLLYIPLVFAFASLAMLALKKARAFVTGAALVVLSLVVAAVIILFPMLSYRESLKPLSLEATAALRPGERIAFFIRKEFAPVFYAEGRVVCAPGEGGVFNALTKDALADELRGESSLIVITSSNWVADLESDGRFNLEFIGEQGSALAFRIKLNETAM
ncbi:MAG TPA: glycosyltransferase family 39 protein [Blastocatellia bacterium]|nr:glycosyltransferase family 39 protein [Blastocatellia bacterium]